ncbi:MAG: ATP-binding cassette domain-containing protein [Desulfarculales bacterium]|jgi:oligopeptide/dipeptide ABC transporter ATP-binding protein|nr:ATP-binding cassette domain-containing protein [Desulfarculales bacterium]
MPLLRLENVSKDYNVNQGFMAGRGIRLSALAGVSLTLTPGQTLALVGESGCGKSTLSRLALALERPSAGRVFFSGQDLNALSPRRLRALRTQMQIVFQDPATSLNPKMTVREILSEPFIIHNRKENMEEEIIFLLRAVGMAPEQARLYPHQFSGGQRQRIGIARALALRPSLLLADEPVSALDVSVQAQVLNLLLTLKEQFGLTYLLIAHDLSVVTHLADRLAIMYLGKIVETMPAAALESFAGLHPYTQALWRSAPSLTPGRKPPPLTGEMPSPLAPPSGCRFHPRCPEALSLCAREEPALQEIGPGHFRACHLEARL